MLRSIVVCPDADLKEKLAAALDLTGAVSILRTIDRYPTTVTDLMRVMRACAPEIVFLSFENENKAKEIVRLLEREAGHVQIVAVHRTIDAKTLHEGMRAGVREFLTAPFEATEVREALVHLKDVLERSPASYESTNQIFTFFPSKAGAGASTIALHVSAAMARRKGLRVLLSDFDLSSGMIRFMLKLDSANSVPEACERCDELDENLWPQLITSVNGLDVLHAGRINPHLRIEVTQVRTLLAYMRRNYQVLCFDISGNMERYSIELMQESKRILLVCTPEVPSLHQAREKMAFLKEFDLTSRVSVILNRVSKKPLFTEAQVSDMVGAPVVRTFPNDYNGVGAALTSGTLVKPGSELGKAFAEFGDTLLNLETQSAAKDPTKRKFLEFLSSPSRAGVGEH